jgi:MGT family glycosyltransferase
MWAPIVVLWEAERIPVAMSSWTLGAQLRGPEAPPLGLGLRAPRTRRDRVVKRVAERATDVLATPMRRRLDALRRRYGLGPLGCSLNEFTGRLPLYLVGSVRELDHGRRDLPPSVHYVGPCLWHPPEEPRTAEWLAGVPAARPWVHVTEGTTHYKEPFLLRAAARGLADGPWEAILTTGRPRDGAELAPPLVGNVHVARWLSHTELLPRCAAIVTTGGAGTVIAALRAGVPLVIVPTTWDKPDNASRVVAAGVGVRLAPRRCTPERLRAAVETVLWDPRYASAARRMQARLAAAPGAPRAADLIESLARPTHARATAGTRGAP